MPIGCHEGYQAPCACGSHDGSSGFSPSISKRNGSRYIADAYNAIASTQYATLRDGGTRARCCNRPVSTTTRSTGDGAKHAAGNPNPGRSGTAHPARPHSAEQLPAHVGPRPPSHPANPQ
jgi:hypothetical protein